MMMKQLTLSVVAIAYLQLSTPATFVADAFAIPEVSNHLATAFVAHSSGSTGNVIQDASIALSSLAPTDLLSSYKQMLNEHPLPTQMLTGATLAVAGDAIAQSQDATIPSYDERRAVSFCMFDMAYRILQHYAFPFIATHCHGQYLGTILPHDFAFFSATMEQTLANQLIIVPFLYYPAFFTMTGYLQGLTMKQTVTRAQETFFFLMKRNLMFWIPIQFIQFGYIEESMQIPFVCVAGLIWTTILSILAGSTKSYAKTPPEEQMEDILLDVVVSANGEVIATEERIKTVANVTSA